MDDIEPEDMKDFKTKLEEFRQAENRAQVSYETDNGTRNEEGQIIFRSEIHFDGVILGTGQGLKKQKAEQAAAKNAYSKIVK